MIITSIDKSQRTAAKIAGFSCLFAMAIVIFANYGPKAGGATGI